MAAATGSETRTRIIFISEEMKREEDKIKPYEETDAYRFTNNRQFKRGLDKGVYEE